jgi:hypothetical protein
MEDFCAALFATSGLSLWVGLQLWDVSCRCHSKYSFCPRYKD